MTQKLHVLYLTWGEVPIKDGIYENQVLGQLLEIKRAAPEIHLSLMAGIPLLNRYTTIERASYPVGLHKIREQLAAAEISFSTRWIWAVAKWFHSKRVHFPFFRWGQLGFLKRVILQEKIDVVHCRGYHAARVAILTRERYGLDFRVITDTRGLFPEEGLLANHYGRDSKDYARWKAVEQQIFELSDAIVNVSETFSEHVRSLTKNRSIHTIHTSTDVGLFQPASQTGRYAIREEFGLQSSEKVLIYVGSLGVDGGWHRLSNLVDVYRVFRQTFTQTKLLIVTRSAHAPIRTELEKSGLWDEAILVAAASRQETSHFLQAADYGALSYYMVEDEIEQLVGYTVIASKTGEYLATGLPMIVNRAAGAAAHMVQEHNIGCTYIAGHESSIREKLQEIDRDYDAVSDRCIELARHHFSATKNAERYIDLYRLLQN